MFALEKPHDIRFGSGPVRKIENWPADALNIQAIGTSHRGTLGISLLQETQQLMEQVLDIPSDYKVAFVSGGGTGSMEFLLWNLLGARPVSVFSAGVFGAHWLHDVQHELKLNAVQSYCAEPGKSLDFYQYDNQSDCVFVWNETTAGTQISDSDWIASDREGLTICDATSAAFCVDLPWKKLDAVSFGWQKGLGGEAGLGTVVLSPRAVECLESYRPYWPMPRLFRIPRVNHTNQINSGFFAGETINTVSLVTVQDMNIALKWAQSVGGLTGLTERVNRNFMLLEEWISTELWIDFLVQDAKQRSKQSVCLIPSHIGMNPPEQWSFLRNMTSFLKKEQIALDILNHSASVPALRIWLGPTVSQTDVVLLLPWLKIAYEYTQKHI